jgi:hypothetical protein
MTKESVAISKNNPFASNIFDTPAETVQAYAHGVRPELVEDIKQQKVALEKRINNGGEPVSLDEFKEIVIPWIRIHRTEVFILNPEKPKKEKKVKEVKPPKEKKATAPKEKKLTAKQVQARISAIVMAKAMGQIISEEDRMFFKEQAGGDI